MRVASLAFRNIEARMISGAISAIDDALKELKDKIDEGTPEKSGRLVDSTMIDWAFFDGNKVVGKIWNATEYAIYVEYGLGRPFKYRKDRVSRRIFRVGNGARMFTRAFDSLQKKLRADFRRKVTKAVK